MTAATRSYIFPPRAALNGEPLNESAQDPRVAAAIAHGYQAGLALGREAAGEELKQAVATACETALEEGRQTGTAQLEQAVASMRTALAEVAALRQALVEEAESFAVELALAAAARFAEIDEVRRDFIKRAIHAGIQTLAPERPIAIVLNPADAAAATGTLEDVPVRCDESITPGGARIDAGRLLVESTLGDALEQIRAAVFTMRTRRARGRRS
jgi:flagellar biosynthesis/type III secretory pathway protein FliH